MNRDYQRCYQALNLGTEANWQEVRQAYRRLARRHHPDRVGASEKERATAAFITISSAYQTLRAYHQRHGLLPGELPSPPSATPHTAPRPRDSSAAIKVRSSASAQTGPLDSHEIKDLTQAIKPRWIRGNATGFRPDSLLSSWGPVLVVALGLAIVLGVLESLS